MKLQIIVANDRKLFLMIHPVCFLIGGLAGQIHAQLLHGVHIHAGQDDRGVHIAALQVGELLEGGCSSGILRGRAGQGNQDLVGVQAGVLAAQIVGLEGLDGLDGGGRNEVKLLVDTGQLFQRVEQSGGSGTQQGAGLAGDNGAVRQLNGGSGGTAGLFRDCMGGLLHRAAALGQSGLIHQQLQLVDLALDLCAVLEVAQGLEVAADDLVAGSFAAGRVIHNAVACHIHAHVGGGVVGALACDQLKHGVDHGEDLNVAVVVDRGLAIGLQMERVDHVHIVQVGGGSLVSQVDRMLQGDVPDGEGLKLGITGFHAPLVFVVQLGAG